MIRTNTVPKCVWPGLGGPVGGFDDPKNGPKVDFIVPHNRKLSFWYKWWYARASRLRETADYYSQGGLLHVR